MVVAVPWMNLRREFIAAVLVFGFCIVQGA